MTQSLVICAHRNLSLVTHQSILLLVSQSDGWRIRHETGDALICRARAIAISKWLRECPHDDVVVMTDDDFVFYPAAIEALVKTTREKRSIVAGVTPLRSGEFTAVVPLAGAMLDEPWLRVTDPVREIKWAGGLIAYHRDVFEDLAATLPLLHERDSIPAFWPFFMPMIAQASDGRKIYLSEDYACHERARQRGFKVWVEPKCQVGHLGTLITTPQNMPQVHDVYATWTLPAA